MRFPMLYSASLLLAGVALPLPLAAQAVVQPLPGTTDADKLADLVRQIGRNPRDVGALVDAGDLSAKLGDTTAAASLYKRASQVDPNNARVQAGIARILVNGEHPGEALRYFNQAERAGLSPALFADDRGLAYDLIGEQDRAQRDYRLALARSGQDNEDEVRRRYALSLGISGRKDEALQQIDALLRKSDRGAWRARAFVLAMNGDAAGANQIATTMMPAGMAGGLAAFFTRLPTLSPADRAFAVHFGEVAPTPERIADARLVPPLPALGPDPYAPRPAPVQLAAQSVATPAQSARGSRRGRDARQVAAATRRARSTPPAQVATITSAASPQPVTQPAPIPTQLAQVPAPLRQVPAPQPSAASSPLPVAAAVTPTQLASATTPARPTYTPQTTAPSIASNLAAAAETRTTVPSSSTSVGSASSAALANNLVRSQAVATPSPVPANVASIAPIAPASNPAPSPASGSAVPATTGLPAASSPAVQVAAASAQPVAPPSARPATPARLENEDTILARIVANISIPASELGVPPMPGAAPQPGSAATIDEAAVAAERNAAAVERRRERAAVATVESRAHANASAKLAATKPDITGGSKSRPAAADERPSPTSRRAGKAKEEVAEVDTDTPASQRATTRASGRKAKLDEPKLTPKQAAAKAKAEAKELADAKAAAAEKKAARAEAERYWVQVAGGATEGDLRKAWKNVRAKSSLLASRGGYTTPLRATNRVVTGPFKTQAEAQAMVNKLSKDGVSAFTFTSEAGQKMTKLGEK
jgi:tetratricopeptide (TPR) repeat protein